MNFFSELNKKLDEGWKLTDSSCPICKASIIYNPVDKSLYCLKCAKPCKQYAAIVDEQPDSNNAQSTTASSKSNTKAVDDTKKPASSQEVTHSLAHKNRQTFDDSEEDPDLSEGSENEFKGYMPSKTDQSRTDDISKLLSQKLLQGYAMLQECCGTCMAPIMRSKTGQYTCVGCKWVKSKKEFDSLIDSANNPQPSKELNSNTNQVQKQPQSEQQQPLQTNPSATAATTAVTGSTSLKPQTQPQAPAQIQKVATSSSSNCNSQEKEEFYKSVQRTLNIAAAFYEGQVAQLVQLNQSSMIDSIVKSSLRELIETQKALEKTE